MQPARLSQHLGPWAARALAAATALACLSPPASSQIAPLPCGVPAEETRWLAEPYSETHTYGLSDGAGSEGWIGSYGGLVAAGDSLFLYDQLRPGIVHLTGELEERGVFGRVGEGPGEFDMPFPAMWIDDIAEGHVAFDGRRLVVYDRHDLASFDPDGRFRWSVRMPTLSMGDGVRLVSPMNDEEVVIGVDSVEAGRRRLQLWRVRRPDPDLRELLWERPVPRRASDDGTLLHRREARSYWARHDDCVVVSDGGTRLLRVIDLSTLQSDSVPLPEWDVPAFGEVPSDHSVLSFGGRDLTSTPREPALLKRWTGLIVDPDGHVWLRAWTQSREEFQVLVFALGSGHTRRVSPPGFPTAFGAPGVFYAAARKHDTDEQYLVRFEGVPHP